MLMEKRGRWRHQHRLVPDTSCVTVPPGLQDALCQEYQAIPVYSSLPATSLFSRSCTLTRPLKFKISLKPGFSLGDVTVLDGLSFPRGRRWLRIYN